MRRGANMRALGRDVGKIGAGDDRPHSGQCPRLFGIDRYDPGVSMGAALDPAPQHTRHRHVGAEIGPARDLVDAVGADRPGADYLKRGLVEIAHLHPPSSRVRCRKWYWKPSLCGVLGTLARPRMVSHPAYKAHQQISRSGVAQTAALPFDRAVVRAAGIRANCHALMPNA